MARQHRTLCAAALCLLSLLGGAAGQVETPALAPAPEPAAANGTVLNSTASQQQLLTFCVPMWQPLVSALTNNRSACCSVWSSQARGRLQCCMAEAPPR